MVVRVHFKHMTSSYALHAHAEEKIRELLVRYGLVAPQAHVTFAVESGRNRVKIDIIAAHGLAVGVESEEAASMGTVIDAAATKLDARLARRKGKL